MKGKLLIQYWFISLEHVKINNSTQETNERKGIRTDLYSVFRLLLLLNVFYIRWSLPWHLVARTWFKASSRSIVGGSFNFNDAGYICMHTFATPSVLVLPSEWVDNKCFGLLLLLLYKLSGELVWMVWYQRPDVSMYFRVMLKSVLSQHSDNSAEIRQVFTSTIKNVESDDFQEAFWIFVFLISTRIIVKCLFTWVIDKFSRCDTRLMKLTTY